MNMKIQTQVIERIEVTGPMEERSKAIAYCGENGYHLISVGPVMIERYKADLSRFVLIAERKSPFMDDDERRPL